MSLPGSAFLAMWHDVEPAAQADYMEWHTREHMPERLSIPGFELGKRLIDEGATRYRYGTVYVARDLEVFRAPPYLERLNNPTAWTGRVQPHFRNFLRVACEKIGSAGLGEGGAMMTIRLQRQSGGQAVSRQGADALCQAILGVPGVAAAHLGLARNEVSDIRTRETEIRCGMAEPGFDAVLLIEGSERAVLQAALPTFEERIAQGGLGLEHPQGNAYHLAYHLAARDMPQP